MDKGALKNTWDRFVTWTKVTFPSQDTLEELHKKGWSKTTSTIPVYTGLVAGFPIEYPVTPEGQTALPGTPEYKLYLDTVREIVEKQDAKQDTKPSP